MRKFAVLVACAGYVASLQPASAVVFATGSNTITNADASLTSRVFRDAAPSTWASPKAFPGVIAQNPTYYQLVNATFAANAFQTIYYEITYSNPTISGSPFSVAYANLFDPANLSTNYLGDAGNSSVSATAVTYQVIVGAGQQLVLNFQAAGSVPAGYTYSVAAFSDANRGENFVTGGAVPEPATWAMMMLGFGATGYALRRRPKANARIRFA